MSNKLNQIIKKQKNQQTEPKKKEMENVIQLVGFVVGDEEYAIPILNIQEIIKPIHFTRVPSVPDFVLGVFNLRGNVLPLIDLRKKFGLPVANQTEDTRYIVMKEGNSEAGFVIDGLTEAIRIKENRIDPPPQTLHEDSDMIYGIGKREDNILTILRVKALLVRDF